MSNECDVVVMMMMIIIMIIRWKKNAKFCGLNLLSMYVTLYFTFNECKEMRVIDVGMNFIFTNQFSGNNSILPPLDSHKFSFYYYNYYHLLSFDVCDIYYVCECVCFCIHICHQMQHQHRGTGQKIQRYKCVQYMRKFTFCRCRNFGQERCEAGCHATPPAVDISKDTWRQLPGAPSEAIYCSLDSLFWLSLCVHLYMRASESVSVCMHVCV